MSLGCCGLANTPIVSKEQQNKKDDDTDLEVSLDSSNSDNCSGRDEGKDDDDDASVATSVVSAVSDLVTGQLALEIGAEMVRSASEVLFGQCQQEMQVLRDIELDSASEASSLYTDDSDDAEDMTLTGFVRMRRSFGRSTSSAARKQQVVEPLLEEEKAEIPETSVSEEAEKYANALAALQQKQAQALEEHHRLKEEERFVSAATASIFPRKPSVAEQVLLEADEEEFSVDMPSDESESKNNSLASEKGLNQNDGFPEPMVVHKIHPQGSTDAQDMSVTDVLPSDFVPFWTEEPSTSSPSTTPEEYASACLKILEDKEESKSQRTKKLSKIVPSFLRKRSMMGKKKN